MEYRIALFGLKHGDPGFAEELHVASGSSYVRERLRIALADHYALKGNQPGFSQFFRGSEENEPSLACGEMLFEPEPDPAELRSLWYLAGMDGGDVCTHLFRKSAASGLLEREDIWRAFRLEASGRNMKSARLVMSLLPKGDRPSNRQLRNSVYKAVTRIKGKHNLDTRRRKELVAVSAMVAARSNPSLVAARWEKFSEYFPQSVNDDVWLAIAVWLAKFHRTDALARFRSVPFDIYDDEARAWRVRAALRATDWEEVLEVIAAMPPSQAVVTAWRYWQGVALQKVGLVEEGEAVLLALGEDADDFYGLLARERIGREIVRTGRMAANDPKISLKVGNNPNLKLAAAVEKAGKRWQGLKIWRWALSELSPEEKLAAAKHADEQGWYLASTFAAEEVPHEIDSLLLRFPTPYLELVGEHAEKLGLDLAFVYGLMRQESRFMPDAVSYANAQGLMQVLPSTAKNVARKNRFTKYRKSRLKRPDTNITIGTHYISELEQSLGKDPILVAAGYNAGPGRPKRWKSRSEDIERLVFIETIPITQTRLYVKHLIANATHYDMVFGLRDPSILNRIGGSY